jgi:hypothetical protein
MERSDNRNAYRRELQSGCDRVGDASGIIELLVELIIFEFPLIEFQLQFLQFSIIILEFQFVFIEFQLQFLQLSIVILEFQFAIIQFQFV